MSIITALVNLRDVLFPENAHKRKLKYLNAIMAEGVVIHPTAQIINFSGNINQILIGKGSHIAGTLQVFNNCGEIHIGELCFVGENTRLISAARIKIGNYVQLAHNINIFDNNIHSLDPEERKVEFLTNLSKGQIRLYNLKEQDVIIEDNVWIGAGSFIMKGVKIGKNTIVGAGSVVVKDLPSNVLAVGNPAKIIRQFEYK